MSEQFKLSLRDDLTLALSKNAHGKNLVECIYSDSNTQLTILRALIDCGKLKDSGAKFKNKLISPVSQFQLDKTIANTKGTLELVYTLIIKLKKPY